MRFSLCPMFLFVYFFVLLNYSYTVVIRYISHELVEKTVVVGQMAIFNPLANEVAKQSAEVFVARKRENTSRIGGHAYKMGQ